MEGDYIAAKRLETVKISTNQPSLRLLSKENKGLLEPIQWDRVQSPHSLERRGVPLTTIPYKEATHSNHSNGWSARLSSSKKQNSKYG